MTTPDRGTTIRPSSTALFTIDSEDRYKTPQEFSLASSSPYNFTIQGSRTLVPGFATRIAATEVMFPWVIPNIIKNKSDKIRVVVNAGAGDVDIDITLNQGFYQPAYLAQQIQAKVVAAGFPSFTLVYGTALDLSGNPAGDMPLFSYNLNLEGTVRFVPLGARGNFKTLFDVMGFKQVTGGSGTIPFGFGNSGITFCQNIRYVDIVSTQLTQNQGMPDSTTQPIQRDAIVRLYVGDATQNIIPSSDAGFTPPGTAPFMLYRQFPYPKQMRWNAEQNIGSYITFQVYDDFGNLLDTNFGDVGGIVGAYDLFSGADWNMSLLITEN
jgi:hypothetical protein